MRTPSFIAAALSAVTLACSGQVTGEFAGGGDPADPDAGAAAGADAAVVEEPDAAGPTTPAAVPRFFDWRGRSLLGDLALTDAVLDGEVVTLAPGGGAPGSDGSGMYNGGEYRVGSAITPEVDTLSPFREAIVSWNAVTPPGSWVEVLISARIGDRWTGDYSMGVWAATGDAVSRHSVSGQRDADGTVYTDTLSLDEAAGAYRVTVRLFHEPGAEPPRLHAVSVATSMPGAAPVQLSPLTEAWGVGVDVPTRSQMIYPDGGEVWCSPTSTTMILAYWGGQLGRPELSETVPAAATATYDSVYRGNGNWVFNTAYAAHRSGGLLRGVVTRLDRIEQLERLTAAGFPVVISASWDAGEIDGAAIASTAGHILIVRGFDADGDVLVNDPAGPANDQVRYTYDRAQLDAAWENSGRTVYLIHPTDRPLPDAGANGQW